MSEPEKERYTQRKSFFDSLLTIYGRKPVYEALTTAGTTPFRLHLAQSNKTNGIIADIISLAEAKTSRFAITAVRRWRGSHGTAVRIKVSP